MQQSEWLFQVSGDLVWCVLTAFQELVNQVNCSPTSWVGFLEIGAGTYPNPGQERTNFRRGKITPKSMRTIRLQLSGEAFEEQVMIDKLVR